MTMKQRRAYRVAFDFHERSNGKDILGEVLQDMAQTASACGNDPFTTALLIAVYDELVREAKP